jgi:hypothetical protein
LKIYLEETLILNQLQNSDSLIDDFDLYELKLYLFEEFWLTYQSKIRISSLWGWNYRKFRTKYYFN